MGRLSIELTEDQHRRLKVAASLKGRTIKEYVLERVFSDGSDSDLEALEDFLAPRIAEAERGEYIAKSPSDIFAEVKKDLEK